MIIQLENIGKKYKYSWIFRGLNQNFQTGNHYSIIGFNGSGKSTLLKIIGGILSPSEGKINWSINGKVPGENLYQVVGISSPHSTLIEEFTLKESLIFHSRFKPFIQSFSASKLIDIAGLNKSADKQLSQFSSGMKQRVKLLLAVLSENQLIILDEPCTNLDRSSINWYQNLINDFAMNRLVVIGSNQPTEECPTCTIFTDLSN